MSQIEDPADPRIKKFHEQRLIARDIDQLLGICEFALSDGTISPDEAEAILDWLKLHRESLETWPASVLFDRLTVMLRDGILDIYEQGDLLGLILTITRPKNETGLVVPASLPVCEPPPEIIFAQRLFCFTGVFDFGSRNQCEHAVEDRGGIPAKGVTKKLNYLVIGNIGSESWKHSSFGNKIAKAVEYRDEGLPIHIINESHWVSLIG